MTRVLVACLAVAMSGCAAIQKDISESPACQGLPSNLVNSDAALIAQLAVELPAEQLGSALDSFSAAKGPQQIACAIEIAEAMLGSPVVPAKPVAPSPLVAALAMRGPSRATEAIAALEQYRLLPQKK